MKVSTSWLKELVDLKIPMEELIKMLPLRTVGIKEVTKDFFELDMKGYNRADLLSLRGVAFETAAITDSSLKFEDEDIKKEDLLRRYQDLKKTNVEVKDEKLVPLYCLVKIQELKVEDSSDSWKQKLLSSGMRPVNNVADVTNLVMIEYGQPLHAFDGDKISDGKIIVRRAREGEKIKTLDGKIRKLEDCDLLITDPKKPVGIAGVMGGENSEITDSTKTIFLEAAIFDPKNLRKTATRLGLQSEASKRFYHGLTQRRLFQALEKAIKYYEELGGEITEISIVGEYPEQMKEIKLTQEKTSSLVGVEIEPEQMEDYLNKLNFTLQREGVKLNHLEGVRDKQQVSWKVKTPYFRLDIELEEDLIEEVARMYGYEKLPSTPLPGEKPRPIDRSLFNLIQNIKNTLVELGLTEVQTYSFFSTSVLTNLAFDKDKLIKVANPISSETEYLRTDLWPNLVEVIDKNLRQGFKDIAIFEIGKVYSPERKEKPKESYRLSIALMNSTDNPTQELYQIFQGVKLVHIQGAQNRKGYGGKDFHPNRFAFLENSRGGSIGFIAEVHPRVINKFGIEQRVTVLEIDLTALL